jgi:hypothetical protein
MLTVLALTSLVKPVYICTKVLQGGITVVSVWWERDGYLLRSLPRRALPEGGIAKLSRKY